jgi:hypothetical protein
MEMSSKYAFAVLTRKIGVFMVLFYDINIYPLFLTG